MQQGDEVTRAAGQDEQVPDGMGLLRISAPVSFGTRHLGPMLFAFMRAHPHLEHALDLSDGMVDIAAEGDDLAIRITRLSPDALLLATRLAESRRIVCCSPDCARHDGVPQTLDDVSHHAGIGYALKSAPQLWRFPGAQPDQPVRVLTPQQRILTNNGEAMRDTAVAGLGSAILPLFIAADDLRSGRLIQILRHAPPEPDAIYAVYPQRRCDAHVVAHCAA